MSDSTNGFSVIHVLTEVVQKNLDTVKRATRVLPPWVEEVMLS